MLYFADLPFVLSPNFQGGMPVKCLTGLCNLLDDFSIHPANCESIQVIILNILHMSAEYRAGTYYS